LIVTAETDEFDDLLLQDWAEEGFEVHYVSYGMGGVDYTKRLHGKADQVCSVSEKYGIVAYGDAAAHVLSIHTISVPRLVAIVAYYPTAIPHPDKTHFPPNLHLAVHIIGPSISVEKTPEVLGIQGKKRLVNRKIQEGLGVGGEMRFSFPAWRYDAPARAGFAESDLEEYDEIASGLAWARSLGCLRTAFGMKVDLEATRDRWVDEIASDPDKAVESTYPEAYVLYGPTMTGGFSETDLKRFYSDFFANAAIIKTRLLSRTVGVDKVVDEILMSFDHSRDLPWILPGIPPTNKHVEIVMVSIFCIKGGKLEHEHIYWDQASVLVQVGILDPKFVPSSLKNEGVKTLPVTGDQAAKAVLVGDSKVNTLIPNW